MSMDGGVVVVEDDSGDENTKVKDANNVAEEDNCMGYGWGQENGWGREAEDVKKGVNDILTNVTAIRRIVANFATSISEQTHGLWKMKQASALWDPGLQLPGDDIT